MYDIILKFFFIVISNIIVFYVYWVWNIIWFYCFYFVYNYKLLLYMLKCIYMYICIDNDLLGFYDKG